MDYARPSGRNSSNATYRRDPDRLVMSTSFHLGEMNILGSMTTSPVRRAGVPFNLRPFPRFDLTYGCLDAR